jgi:hypothetical protein
MRASRHERAIANGKAILDWLDLDITILAKHERAIANGKAILDWLDLDIAILAKHERAIAKHERAIANGKAILDIAILDRAILDWLYLDIAILDIADSGSWVGLICVPLSRGSKGLSLHRHPCRFDTIHRLQGNYTYILTVHHTGLFQLQPS